MLHPRLLGASMITAAALSLGQTPAFAAEPPAPTAAVTLDTAARTLNLGGVVNARDAGGYRTIDGRTVRTGLVFRTGELGKATASDLAALAGDGVASVHDLRTSYEQVLMGTDKLPTGAVEYHDDIIGQAPPQIMLGSLNAGPDMYRAFITAPGANAGFADVLRDIAYNTDGAVLYHCSAGKDRTGWTSAVLLSLLGVDRDTVYYDFLLSNYYRNAADGDTLNGVVAPALDAAFDQVNATYGSFDNYVHDGLGLTDADIAALQAKMLA